MFRTEGLSYTFDTGFNLDYPDLNIAQGDQCLILGESGSGKTTLLHMIGGLRKPINGKVLIDEKDLYSLPSAQLDRFRGKHIGIIFQTSHFVSALNVLENLLLAQKLASQALDKARALHLLDRLNIVDKAANNVNNLSQGEQQRVAIARALINRPDVILADEPTSALDDKNTEQVIVLLKEQASEENTTLVVVSHDNRLISRFDNYIGL